MDERAFAVLRQIRADYPESGRLSLAQFKDLVKEHYLMLCIDQERAIAALPKLLPEAVAERDAALALIAASPGPPASLRATTRPGSRGSRLYSQLRRRPTVSRGRSLL